MSLAIEYDVMGVPATAVYAIEYPLLTAGSWPKRLSTKSADVEDGVVAGAREAKFEGSVAYVVEYSTMTVFSVRREATAEASLAAIFARSRFGIAIAAMIKMIASHDQQLNQRETLLFVLHDLHDVSSDNFLV